MSKVVNFADYKSLESVMVFTACGIFKGKVAKTEDDLSGWFALENAEFISIHGMNVSSNAGEGNFLIRFDQIVAITPIGE